MFYLISLSISARTIHFPFLLPFSRSISFFSCISTVRLFIVLSESPKNFAIPVCVIPGSLRIILIIASSPKCSSKCHSGTLNYWLWHFENQYADICSSTHGLFRAEDFQKTFQGTLLFRVFHFQIVVICPDKSVAEIPWIFRKNIIAYIESEGLQIFYDKNGCCSCVALTKGVYLPYTRSEFRNMFYWFRCRKSRI